MNTSTLWTALRGKLGAARAQKRVIGVQHLVLSDHDIELVQAVLDKVGEQLALKFQLQRHGGEIVLLDGDLVAQMSPQLVHAFIEDRPVATISGLRKSIVLERAAERFEQRRQELLGQLLGMALVRRMSVHFGAAGWDVDGLGSDAASTLPPGGLASGYDSGFDSRLDAEQLDADDLKRDQHELIRHVLRGQRDRSTLPLTASYGPGANMVFNFTSGLVTIDALAQQHLRVRREVPLPAPGAQPRPEATLRELDETLWDLGLASGIFPLVGAPADWWHTALTSPATAAIQRYTRNPGHLEMARLLRAAPVTPSELRVCARMSVTDVRRFLQACLMLGLAQWTSTASTPP